MRSLATRVGAANGSHSLVSLGCIPSKIRATIRYEKSAVKLMRFSGKRLAVVLVIAALPAMAEWQIVEDGFLYMRQNR